MPTPQLRRTPRCAERRRPYSPSTQGSSTVEINRNQYFMAGVIILLLGLQLRLVDSYVLSPETTRILAKQAASQRQQVALVAVQNTAPDLARKVIKPPEWIGWCLLSIGSVLILHSLAMKKQE